MNKVIKKYRIPGYEIKELIKPRVNKDGEKNNGVQLSLTMNLESRTTKSPSNV